MASGRSTKLTGAVGEFLVAAELCRRNLIATPFSGNVPHYDIIASGQFGGHVVIQVKAINHNTWQFDIGKFVQVQFEGERQILGRLRNEPYPDLVCVLVMLRARGADCFFILRWTELQHILVESHRQYLTKHGGRRPKAVQSLHISLSVADVRHREDNWELIEGMLPLEHPSSPSTDTDDR
jgi:hypothetical protein